MSELADKIRTLLRERQNAALTALIDNAESLTTIRENPWDVIPLFIQQLSESNEREDPRFFELCDRLLRLICECIQPDDVILVLIKEIEVISSDLTLLLLLKPLLNALLSVLGTKRVNYLAWALNSVQVYLDEVTVPDNLNLEDDEKLMMDADCNVARISKLYEDLIPFYDTVHGSVKKLRSKDFEVILLRNYIQLLGKPLVFLDMDSEDKPRSKARVVGEFFVGKILDLDRDIFGFLTEDFVRSHEDVRIRILSLSSLFYLCLGERLGVDRIPVVYEHVYVFQNCLKFVVKLLEYDNQFCVEKGLKLAENILRRSSLYVYSSELLDSPYHCRFCKSIAKVIIYNSVETYRKRALAVFKTYLYGFDSRGRYLLIYNIRKTINNTSLNAYITTQYKEMMVQELDGESPVSEYFKASKLRTLLMVFCTLSDGIETDLIKDADQIISALNLLRYLALRDKNNQTNVWDFIKSLNERYLEPLKTALSLSRAHYDVRLKEITEENARGDKLDN